MNKLQYYTFCLFFPFFFLSFTLNPLYGMYYLSPSASLSDREGRFSSLPALTPSVSLSKDREDREEKEEFAKEQWEGVINSGSEEMVTFFIEKYPQLINWRNEKLETACHWAAEKGFLEILRLVLKNGGPVNAVDGEKSPLMSAAFGGNIETVKLLIQCLADVEYEGQGRKPNSMWKAIDWAVSAGHHSIVELLLNSKEIARLRSDGLNERYHLIFPSPNATPVSEEELDQEIVDIKEVKYNWARLMRLSALYNKDEDQKTLKLLLERGQEYINDKKGENNQLSALHVAVLERNFAAAKLLLEKGANVNERVANRDEMTPFQIAAYLPKNKGNFRLTEKIVTLLLANGAEINARDKYDRTALHIATELGYQKFVELLLAKGIDINAKNSRGQTALYLAARHGHTDILELLLYRDGIAINEKDDRGHTALYIAVIFKRLGAIELLLKHWADPDEETNEGWTALQAAAEGGHPQIVHWMLGYDAKPNKANKKKFNKAAIHIAAEKNNGRALSWIIRYEADLEQETELGWTAMHLAGYGGLDAIKVLWKYGAKIDVKNTQKEREGANPLSMAVWRFVEKRVGEYERAYNKKHNSSVPDEQMKLFREEKEEELLEIVKFFVEKGSSTLIAEILAGRMGYEKIRIFLRNHRKKEKYKPRPF